LRIGYLVDTSGNQFELRLPIIEKPSRKLLNALKSVNNARRRQNLVELSLETFFPVTIIDVWNWKSKNDLFLEETKAKLLTLVKDDIESLPEEMRAAIKNLAKIRRTGLLKIWKLTIDAKDGKLIEIRRLLEDWKDIDLETLKKIKISSTHLINKRNKLYENMALWLKINFSYLIWEKDFSLKQIVESAPKISMNSTDVAIKIAAKYRFFASLHFLRQKLKQLDSNGWLIGGTMSYSTLRCYICNLIGKQTPQLHIVCPNGHKCDQDFQACKNLLSYLPEDLVFNKSESKPDIPAHLTKYIIKCSQIQPVMLE